MPCVLKLQIASYCQQRCQNGQLFSENGASYEKSGDIIGAYNIIGIVCVPRSAWHRTKQQQTTT
jgi:hypothetical protein